MRATWSLVRACLVGVGVFLAMTASLCVAFAIAIAGPPTDEELAEFKVAVTDAFQSLGRAAHGASVRLCEEMPKDMSDVLCVRAEENRAQQAPANAPAPEPAPPAPVIEDVSIEPTTTPAPPPQPPLLGGPWTPEARAVSAESHQPARVRRQHRPARAAHTERHRRHQTPARRPPVTARSNAHAPAPPHHEPLPVAAPETPPPEAPAAQQPAAVEAPGAPSEQPDAATAGHDSAHNPTESEARAYEDWADNWTPFEDEARREEAAKPN